MQPVATVESFAICGSCHVRWPTWDEFALDPVVRLLGFQGLVTRPETNLLVFEHRCGSSVSILTSRLRHLLPQRDAEAPPSLRGTGNCPGHCLSLADTGTCEMRCANARERELIRFVREIRGETAA